MTILDVTDYGAVGDGSTNDRAAIQSAIDDATAGDTVYLPEPGDAYLIAHEDKSTDNGGILTLYGNSHPNDLTIAGDGSGSVIRLETGHENNYIMLRVRIQDGITGLEIRDLTFNGNYDDAYETNVGHALGFDETTTAAQDNVDILVEDVKAHDIWRSGFNVSSGGITLNRVTADTCGRHGIAINTTRDGHIHTPMPTVTDSYAVNCGFGTGVTYGINADSRDMVVQDCVIDSCAQGTKVTKDANSCTYRRVRIRNSDRDAAFQRPGSSGSVAVTWDDVVFEDNDGLAMRCVADDDHVIADGGAVVSTNNGAEKMRDVLFTDSASLDTGSGNLYISDSSASVALDWSSVDTGTLDYYGHDSNSGSDIENNGGLTVGTQEGNRTTDLSSVPTAADVGAWSGDSTDDGSTDDGSTDDSFANWTPRWAATTADWSVATGTEYQGDAAMAFEADGTDRTRYAISWDDVGTPGDVEVADRFRVPSFAAESNFGFHARVHLRSGTTNGDENGYWLEVDAPNDSFRLGKYTGGGTTTLARFGAPEPAVFYHRRFRAEGDTVSAKVWPAGEAEPSAWDVQVTDTDHASGWVGAGSYDPELSETDVFSVGVDGASASLFDSDGAPSVAWLAPGAGTTVADGVAIDIDASDSEDADDSLTVEYRVDDGSWTTAAYDADTGSYTGNWDSTTVADGAHTLTARASDSAANVSTTSVDVTVDNRASVATVGAESVSDSAATLVGELTSMGSADSATGSFQYRERGADTWTAVGDQSLTATGRFDAEVTSLSADTGYEYRAVVETDERVVGGTAAFDTDTASGGTSLSIDAFDVTDNSNPAWSRYDVDWTVSDSDGDLNTVITELRNDGVTVASASTNVTGSTASHSHDLRVKGPVDEIMLLVNDSDNNVVSASTSV